jgi:hypothetical protein
LRRFWVKIQQLAGYEDVNDAERPCHDPAMRWVVGGGAPIGRAASASQMGRFETEWLAVLPACGDDVAPGLPFRELVIWGMPARMNMVPERQGEQR